MTLKEGSQTHANHKLMALREDEWNVRTNSIGLHAKIGTEAPNLLRVYFDLGQVLGQVFRRLIDPAFDLIARQVLGQQLQVNVFGKTLNQTEGFSKFLPEKPEL